MDKGAKMKYRLFFIMTMLTVLLPLTGIGLFLADMLGVIEHNSQLYIVDCIFVMSFLLRKPLEKEMNKYKQMAEYDEFGLKKKKNGRYDLSKEERRALDLQQMANMERLISETTLKKITKKGSVNPDRDMDKLIGLGPVKQKMKEMVARMEFEKYSRKNKKENMSMSGRHMVFYGNPGTGKTTVARIITGFLYKNKYISSNKIIEVDGNFLKAGSPGDTATKVKLVLRYAYGGVLFIDEAYALMDSGDGCGAEAIATLIAEMENNRNRFILIMAGYTREMKMLLEQNPGFESRIKEYLVFPDYNETEARQIFMTMAAEQNFVVNGDAYEAFDERMAKERRLRSFGNARTIRNVLDESIDKHALNYVENRMEKSQKYILMPCDISRNINKSNFTY